MIKENDTILVVKIHIELQPVNNLPVLVYTDIHGKEWVQKEDCYLEPKETSWYFKTP